VGKVDLDNLVKFTLDVIGGVAFVDHGQISELNCSKVWVENPGSTSCIISKLVD
jgi:Holliday junction resolvase RusA-like endonuclease